VLYGVGMAEPTIYNEAARMAYWGAQPDSNPRSDRQIVLSEELEIVAAFLEEIASADIDRDPDATARLLAELQATIAAHVPSGAERLAAFVPGQFGDTV